MNSDLMLDKYRGKPLHYNTITIFYFSWSLVPSQYSSCSGHPGTSVVSCAGWEGLPHTCHTIAGFSPHTAEEFSAVPDLHHISPDVVAI